MDVPLFLFYFRPLLINLKHGTYNSNMKIMNIDLTGGFVILN